MSCYEINSIAVSSVHPFLNSLFTSGSQEALPYEVFMDHDTLESLNLVHAQTFQPLYASKPQEIIGAQIEHFKQFQEYPYLYFFGIGNGVLLKQLLCNPKHQRIVVVEPEPFIFYVVLHLIDFSQELASGRLVLLVQEQLNFPTISALFADFWPLRYAKVYDLHVMSAYYEAHASLIQQSNRLFIECLHQTIQTAGNDTKDALIGLKHHITNLPLIPQTPPLINFLKQAHISDVAILVSTGPSLGKQLFLLKEIAPYVTIFAVDASLPILIKNGIKPDVVTSIERVPQTSRFFKEIPKTAMEGVVTVLSSIQHAEVIDSVVEGDKLISLRPLGYMMLTGPNAWGYAGIGMSSANMAYELIYHSHFKMCILIGQDLAYSEDGKSHANGHLFGENNVKQNDSDGWAVAYGGEGRVKTTAVWNMFRGSFEKDIAETSKRMLTINATEGGVRIFGTQELPFSQALALHVKKNRVKQPLKVSKIGLKEQHIILDEVNHNVETIKHYVQNWQKKIEALFLDVTHMCEALDAKQDITASTLQVLLERISAVQKARNEEMFDKVIWHIAQSMMLVQDIAIAPIEVVYSADEKSQYAKMTQLLYAYKSWLFALAGSMDAIVKTITYSQGRSLIHTVESIDVWVDDVRIDTLTCKDMTAQNGRVFDVEMRGILYDVPDEYLGKNVFFKDAKTKEMLPAAFVHVIDRMDEQYNKLRFMANLEEPVDTEKIKDLYCPNVIGFLATEENLEDEVFVEYIGELNSKFPFVNLKIFYFKNKIKELCQNRLKLTNIQYISPLNSLDIINEVEIYIKYKEDSTFGSIVLSHCPNIYLINFLKNMHYEFLGEYNNNTNQKTSLQMQNFRAFGYDEDDLKEAAYNIYRMNFAKVLRKIDDPCFVIHDEKNMHELLHIDSIVYALKYPEFKHRFFELRSIMRKLQDKYSRCNNVKA